VERRHAQNAEWTAAAPVRVSARGLFACCFKRFCESSRGFGQGRVRGHDLCQAVARSASLSRSTAASNRVQSSSGPRRPVPGRSSYGGLARLDPATGRHARPASSARACASRIAAAASDNARRRPRKRGSGGANSCARIAPAHDACASRTASQAASLPATSAVPCSSEASTMPSYRTRRPSGSGVARAKPLLAPKSRSPTPIDGSIQPYLCRLGAGA
jgi:hypothetical protein